MYLNLRNGFEKENEHYSDSIHFLRIPTYQGDELVDQQILTSVSHMKKLVELVRQARDNIGIPIKKPIKKVTIINSDASVSKALESLNSYFQSEINSMEIVETSDEDAFVTYEIDFNHKTLGQRLKQGYNAKFRSTVSELSKADIDKFIRDGQIEVAGTTVYSEDLHLHKKFKPEVVEGEHVRGITDDTYAVLIDYSTSQEIEDQYMVREFITTIQKFRKDLELSIDDDIQIFYDTKSSKIEKILASQTEKISSAVLKSFSKLNSKDMQNTEAKEFEFDGEKAIIYICKL